METLEQQKSGAGTGATPVSIHRGLTARIRAIVSLSYYTGILVVIRSPGFIVFTSTTPFTVLFFLFVVGGGKYLPYGVVGATISILVQAGLFLGADATFNRVQFKFQDFCVASPLSAVDYMIGLSLGELTFTTPSLAGIDRPLRLPGANRVEFSYRRSNHARGVDNVLGTGFFLIHFHTAEQERVFRDVSGRDIVDGHSARVLSHSGDSSELPVPCVSCPDDASLHSHAIYPWPPAIFSKPALH